jgi:hypothetical protein
LEEEEVCFDGLEALLVLFFILEEAVHAGGACFHGWRAVDVQFSEWQLSP